MDFIPGLRFSRPFCFLCRWLGYEGSKKTKHCEFCGRFYRPDPRVKHPRACSRPECRKKRKQASQRAWVRKNPDYFKGRSENTKAWRLVNPDYQKRRRARRAEIQDAIAPKSPLKSMTLMVPVSWAAEIQDEIRLVRQCGCGVFKVGPPQTRLEIQDVMAGSPTAPLQPPP